MQFELTKDFIDEIINAIENANDDFIIEKLHSLHPVDIAEDNAYCQSPAGTIYI